MFKSSSYKILVSFAFLQLAPVSNSGSQDPIAYWAQATIPQVATHSVQRLSPILEEFMPPDTLVQHLGKDNLPISYSKNIQTNVCFDKQCRILIAQLHWNPTGRYLGFSLPEGEFLSKKDHDPFLSEEYERLNELLADPNLPLGSISYNELVLNSAPPIPGIDGVSGATNTDLLDYIVEGAAYTTYKLYQILYGPDQQFIQNWTMDCLTDELILQLVDSPVVQDKIWILTALRNRAHEYPRARKKLLELTRDPNFSISDNALQTFSSKDLLENTIQTELVELLETSDFGRANRLLDLFDQAESLSDKTLHKINNYMLRAQAPIQTRIIKLFREHKAFTTGIRRNVQQLQQSNNSFVSREASSYLNQFN